MVLREVRLLSWELRAAPAPRDDLLRRASTGPGAARSCKRQAQKGVYWAWRGERERPLLGLAAVKGF